jgi:CrcB protein
VVSARDWAAVALGGALGALLRVLVGEWSDWGTLIANTTGSALVGWYVASRFSGIPVQDRFFVDGFCGGYTTFAIFSVEVLVLADSPWLAVGYATLMGASALVAAAIGGRWGHKKPGVRPLSTA